MFEDHSGDGGRKAFKSRRVLAGVTNPSKGVQDQEIIRTRVSQSLWLLGREGVTLNGRNTEKDITSEGLRIVHITWGWKTNIFTGLYCICRP